VFALDEMKSVYVKDGSCKWTPPGRVRVFEIYRDADAYKAHIQTPHFKKFRATTDNMRTSRKLVDTVPISLAAKAK